MADSKIPSPVQSTPDVGARPRRKRRNPQKGQNFERAICKKLSLWWTGGKRDDVFWRTSLSGGRATVRRRLGKGTKCQEGDVFATDPVGKPLTDAFAVEIKCGRQVPALGEFIEGVQKNKTWENWYRQVRAAQRHSGAASWLLICRGHCKREVVFFSQEGPLRYLVPTFCLHATILEEGVTAMSLDEFCNRVSAKDVWRITNDRSDPISDQ